MRTLQSKDYYSIDDIIYSNITKFSDTIVGRDYKIIDAKNDYDIDRKAYIGCIVHRFDELLMITQGYCIGDYWEAKYFCNADPYFTIEETYD